MSDFLFDSLMRTTSIRSKTRIISNIIMEFLHGDISMSKLQKYLRVAEDNNILYSALRNGAELALRGMRDISKTRKFYKETSIIMSRIDALTEYDPIMIDAIINLPPDILNVIMN